MYSSLKNFNLILLIKSTLLDLIRHGRNERERHHQPKHKDAFSANSDEMETPSPLPQSRSHKDPITDMLSHVPKRMEEQHQNESQQYQNESQQYQQQRQEKRRADEYAKEAEMIVEEEKRERSKMVS